MAAQMIDFSIIIPHYNIPHSLQRLLDTIPDEPNLEVIVIDDNSDKETEALKQIIDKYSNDRRIFLKNVIDNKGAGASRNIGIQHARGKWLIFADSDDMFGEDFYRIISGNKDRSEDLIFFMPYKCRTDILNSVKYLKNIMMAQVKKMNMCSDIRWSHLGVS